MVVAVPRACERLPSPGAASKIQKSFERGI
jgi:hypothetical protein